ncbi:hypothetical protein F2Q69_00051936 [Brassica cretica]|uniref:Uncharacterized protein n=1 Tax=Brassica cretica TaxID=69181 RepID=A0A8S9PLQ8_BRACR|nr:hypothetical protein F2Q69_00051936 [Brassica cretica]
MTPQTLSSKGNLHHPGPQEVVNPLQGHRYADAVVVIVVVVLHLGDLLGQRASKCFNRDEAHEQSKKE